MKDRDTSRVVDKSILNQSVVLYVCTCTAVLLKFAGGFLIAKFLGPTLYGLRTMFGLVMEYQYYTHMGTLDALGREVPFQRGRKDASAVQIILANVFGVNFAYALVVCVAMFVLAHYLSFYGYQQVYVDFAVFIGFYEPVSKFRDFYLARLIADKAVDLVSAEKLLFGIVNSILCVVLVFYFDMRGLFIGLLCSQAISVIYLFANLREVPSIALSPRVIVGLVKIGFPIMLIGLAFMALTSVDKILIASLLSHEMLGYYAIATIVSGFVYAGVAEAMTVILYPRLMERLGETTDLARIKIFLIDPTILVAYFVPFLIGAVFLGIRLPLEYFLPEYLPATAVVKILIVGSFFFCVFTMSMLVCVALNRQRRLLVMTFAAIMLNAIVSYTLIAMNWSIDGVAVGTAASYLAYGFSVGWYASIQFGMSLRDYVGLVFLTLAPILYAIILLLVIDNVVGIVASGFWSDVMRTAMKFVIFAVAYSLIFLLVRKHAAFTRLVNFFPDLQARARSHLW